MDDLLTTTTSVDTDATTTYAALHLVKDQPATDIAPTVATHHSSGFDLMGGADRTAMDAIGGADLVHFDLFAGPDTLSSYAMGATDRFATHTMGAADEGTFDVMGRQA
jgi:hypothetical protein